MLAEFIVVSFASFIGYQVFRMWLSFIPVNAYTAPIFAFAIACGFTVLIDTRTISIIVPVAATGGVAVLNKITDVSSPDPARFPVKLPRRHGTQSEPRERIPSL